MIDDTSSTDTALPVETSHFESRKIQPADDGSLLIKPTIAALAYGLLFVLLGLAIGALWSISRFTSFEGPDSSPLLLIVALFLVAGLATYFSNNEQVLINHSDGVKFIRSWRPAVSAQESSHYKLVPAQDIVAIQTVSRFIKRRSNRGKRNGSYTEYQVNLCTQDNLRHNVFITLKPESAEQLAQRIALLFNVPVRAQ